MRKIVMAAAMVAVSLASLAAQDAAKAQKFGAGVSAKEPVAMTDLYATPEKFVGKTVRVDGVVSDVCTEMGCWMAIVSEKEPGLIVRIKVEDGGDIVFPVSAKGKKVSAEGVFEKIKADDKESLEAASESKASGAKAAAFGKTYQLKGLGAYVY